MNRIKRNFEDPLRTFFPENDVKGSHSMGSGSLPFYYFTATDVECQHYTFAILMIDLIDKKLYEIWLMNADGDTMKLIDEYVITKDEIEKRRNTLVVEFKNYTEYRSEVPVEYNDYDVIKDYLMDTYFSDTVSILKGKTLF